MRAYLHDVVVVQVEAKDWAFNGKSGTRFAVYVRGTEASPASAALMVKCSAGQMTKFSEGQVVDVLPVDVFSNTTEYQGVITGAKTSWSLDPQYDPSAVGGHAASRPHAVAN